MFLSFSFTPWTHDVVCNIIRSKETKALYLGEPSLDGLQYPLQLSPMFSRVLWKRVKCRARGILIRLAPFPLAVWSGPFSTAVWHKASSLACRATFPAAAGPLGPGLAHSAAHWGPGPEAGIRPRRWNTPPHAGGVNRWRRRGSCGFAHKLHKSQRKTIVPQSQADSLRHRAVFVSLHSTRSVCCYLCLKRLECGFIWFMIEGLCSSLQSALWSI